MYIYGVRIYASVNVAQNTTITLSVLFIHYLINQLQLLQPFYTVFC